MPLSRLPGALAGYPHRVDVLLAALFCGLSLTQVLLQPIASLPVSVLVAVGSTLPVAWRRTRPAGAALAGCLVWLIPTNGFIFLGYVVAILLFFSVGAYVAKLWPAVAVTVTGSAIGVFATLRGPEAPPAAIGAVLAVAAPAIVGRLVARQRAQAVQLQQLARDLVRERAQAERSAVADERARIARELHDIVGHDVSVIALQADAAAAAIEKAPQLAIRPIAAIRESAGQALGELRQVLGALRQEGDEPDLHPQPGLADLPTLVDRARGAGMRVDLVTEGTPRAVAPAVALAAFRLIQEALTNARKHALGASVRLDVSWRPQSLTLRVTDSGPGPVPGTRSGYGLTGMRERVRFVGGSLRTGPSHTGGFEVVAVLPLDPPAST